MSMEHTKKTYTSFFEIDITPDYPVDLIGFNRGDKKSKGILHRLYAQVALFKSGEKQYLIITVDNIGLSVKESDDVRRAIASVSGIDVCDIMLCFTHTHSAPDTYEGSEQGKRYYDFLKSCLCTGVIQAQDGFVECMAGWGIASGQIGLNRRVDGGLTDDDIGILKVTDMQGNLLYMMLRVSAHGNVLIRDNYFISSDFVGVARQHLKDRYGCGMVITQGACGNIKPKYCGKQSDLVKMSDVICKAISDIIDDIQVKNIADIIMFSKIKDIPTIDIPNVVDAKALSDRALKECGIDGEEWLYDIDRLRESGVKQQIANVEFQFLVINNGCLCGIPMEPFCEMGIKIREKAKEHGKLVFFGGYTNGCDGYLPTKKEHYVGGYEVNYSYMIFGSYFDRYLPLVPEADDIIVDTVIKEIF